MRYFTHTNKYGEDLIRAVLDNAVLWIPCSETNTDYQAYLAWVAEGNTAEEWSPDDAS